jgi:uncharacterized protein YndB with AHSA1/START domain
MTTTASVAPLTKRATIPCSPDRAFVMFTAEMSSWWPLGTHSVGEMAAARVDVDGRLHGRIVETLTDGSTADWGTVTAWEPPRRLAFTWHPGTPPEESTAVEVTFDPAPTGDGTVVTLVHSGWPAGPDAAAARKNYDTGWDYVLSRYVATVT